MKLFKLPFIAALIAFVLAALSFVSIFRSIILIFFAFISLIAGIGIVQRRVWSAYGFALFELGQLGVTSLVLSREGTVSKAQIIFSIGLTAALIVLFALAGRSLSKSGAKRGSPYPWIAVTCLFTLPFLFVRPFVIPTGAMEDTLLIGDHILALTFPRGSVARNDIVVFRYPIDRQQVFIKRVIGVPGDRIRIASKIVYLNGKPLTEPYATYKFNNLDLYRDNCPSDPASLLRVGLPNYAAVKDMVQNHVIDGEVVVPAGKYFVLGDNRDNSLDSRYWGFLDSSDLIGKPILIYDSQEQAAAAAGVNKSFSRHRIRWNRIFKPL